MEFQRETFGTVHNNYGQILRTFGTLYWGAEIVLLMYRTVYYLNKKCCRLYRGADKSLARPNSPCVLFDGENISFDTSLYMYIHTYTYIYVCI